MKSFFNILIVLLSMLLFSTLSLCDGPEDGPEDGPDSEVPAAASGAIMQCAIKYELSWSDNHVWLVSYKWMNTPDYNSDGQTMAAIVNSYYSPRNQEIIIPLAQSGLQKDITIHVQKAGLPFGYLKYGDVDLNFNDGTQCKWDPGHILYCPFEC